MRERWIPVKGFETHYHVSDRGRVRRVLASAGARPMILSPEISLLGYRRVALWKNGVKTRVQVHRLVMAGFVGDSILSVNHKNGDPSDNRLCNLEYLTMADNLKDSWKRGTRVGLNQGSRHGMHKLTEVEVREIRERRDRGETIASLAAAFSISTGSVSMIANRRTWLHI